MLRCTLLAANVNFPISPPKTPGASTDASAVDDGADLKMEIT